MHVLVRRVVLGAATAGLLMAFASVASAQVSADRAAALPPAVLTSFQKAYPAATIAAVCQERAADRTRFRVESLDKGRRRVVLYDGSGAVLEVAEAVDERELPPPVAAAMHSHPRAIYVSGLRVTRGAEVQYRLTLRGTRKTALVARPDGTVVSFE